MYQDYAMKTFKEYLTESKKVYEFKVKLAGDYEKAAEQIKMALAPYKVEKCSAGKRLPIAETHSDFPSIKNTNVTIFDVCTAYPTNSQTIRALIAEKCGCTLDRVKVRTPMEEAEELINHQHDEKSGESLLTKDYEPNAEGQKVVGEKRVMSLIKELSKIKHGGEVVKGTNEALLSNNVPNEKLESETAKPNTKSPVGSRTVKKPTAKTVGV